MRLVFSALLLGLAASALDACSSETNRRPAAPDQRLVADTQARHDQRMVVDHRPTSDSGSAPDIEVKREVTVWVSSPLHLSSLQAADAVIDLDLSIYSALMAPALALSQIQGAFSLLALPAKTQVAGTWKLDTSFPYDAKFVPSSPLGGDADYLVAFKKTAAVVPRREQTVFRVGSLPRVSAIDFHPSTTNQNETELVRVLFSEPVECAKAASSMVISVAKTGAPIQTTLFTTATAHQEVVLKVAPGTPLDSKISILVGTDVGAANAVKLDGKYSGAPGSGPLVVELVPKDYPGGTPWEPSLSW